MVVEQGSIIKVSFNPTVGHEQAGYRPAVVINNKTFNKHTNLLIVLPISTKDNGFPLHVPLDERCKIKGFVLCEHLKSIDSNARKIKVIEKLPKDIFKRVLALVRAEILVE